MSENLPIRLPVKPLDVGPHAVLIQDSNLQDVLMVCKGYQLPEEYRITNYVVNAMNVYHHLMQAVENAHCAMGHNGWEDGTPEQKSVFNMVANARAMNKWVHSNMDFPPTSTTGART